MRTTVAAAASLLLLAGSAGAARQAPGGLIVFATNRSPNLYRTLYYRVDLSSRQVVRLGQLFSGTTEATTSPDGRWIAFRARCKLFVRRFGTGNARRLGPSGGGCVTHIAFSPDGRRIAFTRMEDCDGVVYVVDRVSGRYVEVATGGWPSWSPDGKSIAYGADIACIGPFPTTIHVVGSDGKHDHWIAGNISTPPSWSPRGDSIVFERIGRGIYSIRPSGKGTKLIAPGGTLAQAVWSSNGARLAYTAFDGGGIYAVGPRGEHRRFLADYGTPRAWSRDGRRLAFFAFPGSLRVADGEGLGRLVVRAPWSAEFSDVRWSRNGRTLAYALYLPSNDYEIASVSPAGTHLRLLTHNLVEDRQPALSPDGSRIAFVRNGRLYLMSAGGARQRPLLPSPADAQDSDPAWSPDGHRIAFIRTSSTSNRGGTLSVVSADGSGLRELPVHNVLRSRISWSPDGTAIAFTEFDYDDQHGGQVSIYLVSPEGMDKRPIGPPGSFAPGFAPNAERIVFTHGDSFGQSPWTLDLRTGETRNLTNAESAPDANGGAWSPDATRVVFSTGSDTDSDLLTLNLATNGTRVLTGPGAASNIEPDWR